MNIVIAYTCVTNGEATMFYATRFAASYQAYPPGFPHRVVTICNGGSPKSSIAALLSMVNGEPFNRSNDGWDIGGYIEAASGPCREADLMICLGESVYFHRAGWLPKLVETWKQHGDGMYGFFSSNLLRPHLQTTAFATSPQLLRSYPMVVKTKKDRYDFEHGNNSFMKRLSVQGNPARLVTWDGCWSGEVWRAPENILWKGDQSNCLMWCNHTDNYFKLNQKFKSGWENCANGIRQ